MSGKLLVRRFPLAVVVAAGICGLAATPSPHPQASAPPRASATDGSSGKTLVPNPGATTSALTIGTPGIQPSVINVGTPVSVTITATVTDPSLIPNSVTLLRLGPAGSQPTVLGIMHDDGKNGDATANDGLFTLSISFNEASAGLISLEASAAFKGLLKRVISAPAGLAVIYPQANGTVIVNETLDGNPITSGTFTLTNSAGAVIPAAAATAVAVPPDLYTVTSTNSPANSVLANILPCNVPFRGMCAATLSGPPLVFTLQFTSSPPFAGFTIAQTPNGPSITEGQTLSVTAQAGGNATVSIDGTRSFGFNATIANWQWSIDGTVSNTSTGSSFTRTFGVGSHAVSLVVTDSRGVQSSSVSGSVTVAPPPPTARFSVSVGPGGTGRDGQVLHGFGGSGQVVLDATGLSSSPNGPITGWEWTLDNVRVGNSAPVLFQNMLYPLHLVSLVVVDSTGVRSAPAKATVVFDGPLGAWVRLPLASGPSPTRRGYAVAYDVAHRRGVLFGGYDQNGQALADTWLWDGFSWSKSNPLNSPPARSGHSMVYDSARNQIVLFGGLTNPNGGAASSTLFHDTWTWDGSNWLQANDAVINPPPARWSAGAAFDAARNLVLLFGGQDLNGTVLGDTWVWDGSVWSTRPTGSMPARAFAESRFLTYDYTLQQTLVFGGLASPGNYLNDMWEWNGMPWQLIQPSPKPPTMSVADLVYNGGFPEVLLFGTPWNNGQPLPPQTWTWRNQTWRQWPNVAGPAFAGPSSGQLFYDATLGKCIVLDPTDGSTWMWNDYPY